MTTLHDINVALGIDGDSPVLVYWKESLSDVDGKEWQPLTEHDCNGFSIDQFGGFVIPVEHDGSAEKILHAIVDERFCAQVSSSDVVRSVAGSLDWGVEEAHRRAYAAFIESYGLKAGRLDLLQQAVYPLAATAVNLDRLGAESLYLPPAGAELLVLGFNCD